MVASTAAILVCGLIADRVPVRDVMAGLARALAGALVILMVGSAVSDFAFEVLLGIALGGGQAVRIAARGIYFGRSSFATIAATAVLLVLPFQLIAIPSHHNLYELTDGTTIPLFLALAGCLIAGLGYLLAGLPQLSSVAAVRSRVLMSTPKHPPPIRRFNFAGSILRYRPLLVRVVIVLAVMPLLIGACVHADVCSGVGDSTNGRFASAGRRGRLPPQSPHTYLWRRQSRVKTPPADPSQSTSEAVTPTLASELAPTNPPPTPTLQREWRLLEWTVRGDTVVVDLHMCAGVDVKVALGGRDPDSVDWTGSTSAMVFPRTSPPEHTRWSCTTSWDSQNPSMWRFRSRLNYSPHHSLSRKTRSTARWVLIDDPASDLH